MIGESGYRRRGIYHGGERGGTDACLNLKNSGTLSPGYYADIARFNPQTVKDTATFEVSRSRPESIVHVPMNVVSVMKDSQFTHRSPGRPLKPRA